MKNNKEERIKEIEAEIVDLVYKRSNELIDSSYDLFTEQIKMKTDALTELKNL